MAAFQAGTYDAPDRTYVAGTDLAPPESVPLTAADFESESERRAILEPWRVTDERGALLPEWRSSQLVFPPRRTARAAGRPAEPAVL